jgi:hypothetical protein
MTNRFADDTHKLQAEEFIFELGRFVLAFERICEEMRYNVMFMLRSQGLQNSGIEQVLIGDKVSAELQVLLGAIFCELPAQDEEDRRCVKELLKSIKGLSEIRNILLHNAWNLGTEAADSELVAGIVRFRTKQSRGSEVEVHGYSASYLRELIQEAERIQVLMQRLQYCIIQKGFKVSTEFTKMM